MRVIYCDSQQDGLVLTTHYNATIVPRVGEQVVINDMVYTVQRVGYVSINSEIDKVMVILRRGN